nr:DUF2182 domain-containing protein [Pseudomonadota bacterium]
MRSASTLKADAVVPDAPVWFGMAAIAAMSWFYLATMGAKMATMGGSASAHGGMAMGGAASQGLLTAFVMWAAMMMAMMLPAAGPSAALFSTLAAKRAQERGTRTRTTALYVTGYAAPWIAFAALAALAQQTLTHLLLLDPMARSTSALLSSAILLAAGTYQWLPVKRACLSKCRTPLAFFMARWRDGATGALVLGLQHGGYCVACCWALMAVMFVVGAMSLAWMGLFMLLVLGEKVIPARWRFDRTIGVTFLVSGLW